MRRPVSGGFKVVLSVTVLVVLGTAAALIADALQLNPNIEMVSATVKVTHNVPFGRVDHQALYLDVYEPRRWSLKPRPALLLIHGGGWVEGDKNSESDLASYLVPQGYVAFAVNYRLAYEGMNKYPTQLLDVRRAARWVRTHAHEFGADPTRVGALGYSAGGHLAALLGTTDVADPDDPNSLKASSRVDCVVDLAGPADFTDENSPAVGPKIARVIPLLFGKSRDEIPGAYRDASPVYHADSHSAPTLIAHGVDDQIVPIDQSRRLEHALKAAGTEVKLIEFSGEDHGVNQPANFQRWLDEISGFLANHLQR